MSAHLFHISCLPVLALFYTLHSHFLTWLLLTTLVACTKLGYTCIILKISRSSPGHRSLLPDNGLFLRLYTPPCTKVGRFSDCLTRKILFFYKFPDITLFFAAVFDMAIQMPPFTSPHLYKNRTSEQNLVGSHPDFVQIVHHKTFRLQPDSQNS